MKKLIICSKASGNTYKVCSYLSQNEDIDFEVVNERSKINLGEYDLVILSSGIYGGHVHKNILKWVANLEGDINAKFYMFLTWFGREGSDKTALDEVKNVLENKGLKLEDNYVKCFGKGMGVIRRSHPNEEDNKKVLSWVKEL